MNLPDYALAILVAIPILFVGAAGLSALLSWRGPKGPTRFRR
jgi:hypothetical protein